MEQCKKNCADMDCPCPSTPTEAGEAPDLASRNALRYLAERKYADYPSHRTALDFVRLPELLAEYATTLHELRETRHELGALQQLHVGCELDAAIAAQELAASRTREAEARLRSEAAIEVATKSINASMATARTARQVMAVLNQRGPTVEGYQGLVEVLIEKLEEYTPAAPPTPVEEGGQGK